MTLSVLYDSLKSELENDRLTISHKTADGAYSQLLNNVNLKEVVILSCSVALNAVNVVVSGQVEILPYTSIGPTSVVIISSLDYDILPNKVNYSVTLSVSGSGELADFCGKLPSSYGISNKAQDSYFSKFVIYNPVLEYNSEKTIPSSVWSVSGFATCPNSDKRWNDYRALLSDKMPFKGIIDTISDWITICDLNFMTQKSITLPFGKAVADIAMRVIEGDPCINDLYITRAYLLYDIKLKSTSQTATFQSQLFAESEYQSSATFFLPPLSLSSIVDFMQSLFGISGNRLLLPEDTMLSSFGLQELQMILSKKGNTLLDGMSIERIYSIFSLANPIDTFIPNLILEKFCMIWEISWWGNPEPVVTLFAVAKTTLQIGSYKLIGELSGCFPVMVFEGELKLEKNLSLTELAGEYNIPIPKDWNGESKEIASLNISASVRSRAFGFNASVSDIITITIGDLKLSLDKLTVFVETAPSKLSFGIQGIIDFVPRGFDPFAFTLSAKYQDKDWLFSGELSSGKVNIGGLLMALFSVESSKSAVSIELDSFEISYSVNDKRFKLYASFSSSWFTVFGVTPKLGGKIMLDKTEKELEASAALFLDIGNFRFLVQANDFYSDENRWFLFRLEFMKKYIQAVYQKVNEEEIVTVTLGGLTFGDILLALIHLINPNAKQSLSSPWDVLNKIKLSNFSLVVNVTKKSASLLYHADLNVAGLMQIDDIGLSYDSEKGISYVLTGRLLDKTYTSAKPLTWDAVNGSPPANCATDEKKVKLYYLGVGNHLNLQINKQTISDILQEIKTQLTPVSGVPSVRYAEKSGWVFGIDLELSDMFRVKLLFYSPVLYGAVIEVHATENSPLALFNGMMMELYYKKISDTTGMLHCRLIVPKKYADFNLGAISIHLGQFLLEIYTNGSFFIDLGFPHNNDFSNSFGLSVGIFGGKGGLYFGVLFGDAVNAVPVVTNGAFTPVIRLGIGLSIGISRSFDFGVVKGGVSLTMVGIFEGTFAIFCPRDKKLPQAFYYKVKAVVGISGSLFLSVDFKIIAISASAMVSAFCELAIESYKKTLIGLTLDIKLSASIKILFFKIKFSFHFNYKASFTIGSDSTPPWRLANSVVSQKCMLNSMPITVCSGKSVGSWRISPVISPLCSILNPNEDAKKYCLAFTLIISDADLHSIIEMLTKWVLSHVIGENVSFQDAEEIKSADFGGTLEYNELIELLSMNITILPKLQVQNKGNEICNGFIFPMLPQLSLIINDAEMDFSENYISEADMQRISEYFYQLNADPIYSLSKNLRVENNSIPICGAILNDWFKMALSEITGKIGILFSSISVSTDSLNDTVELYGTDMECVLLDNPDLTLKIDSLPNHTITISNGDTLHKIQEKYKLSKADLWNAVSNSNSLLQSTVAVTYDDKYRFDNRKTRLTVLQASAMFFVRLFNPDIVFAPYAEFILENNSIDMSWECKFVSETTITVPKGKYTALSGDTVVRISKMLCLIDDQCDLDEWITFKDKFVSNNGGDPSAVIDSYIVSKDSVTFSVTGFSNCLSLFSACYPDFLAVSDNHSLWSTEILRPLANITLSKIVVSHECKLYDLMEKYHVQSIASAVKQRTAQLSCQQSVIISMPNVITKSELLKKILETGNVSQIGSILSRSFMQGARPPAPSTKTETPLYKLLNQQIELESLDIEHKLYVKRNATGASWIEPSSDETVLSKDDLRKLLPTGELGTVAMPTVTEPLHSQPKCWSVTKGLKVLSNISSQVIASLSKDCIRYLNLHKTLPRLERNNNAMSEFSWCSIVPIRVLRKNDGVYFLYGASADNRALLHNLTNASKKQCRLMYSPSKLDSENSGLSSIDFKECKIIKTNLSKETHYGMRLAKDYDNPYIASIAESEKFLTLVWECSVIGGGFWLYHDGDALPSTIFDDEGTATFQLIVALDSNSVQHNAINGIILPDSNEGYALLGDDEQVYSPALPAGCVGLKCSRDYNENDSVQNLYQLLGYSVYSEALGQRVESASILPVANGDDKLEYTVAVPLWKLTNKPLLHAYSSINKEYKLLFSLRDVLGNTEKIGEVSVTSKYNDNVIALNELPDTKINYVFLTDNSLVFVKITCSYSPNTNSANAKGNGNNDTQTANINTAKTAMHQLSCSDIEITAETTLNNAVHNTGAETINQIREYVTKLYENLRDSGCNSISPVEILVPVNVNTVPTEIIPLNVYVTVRRTLAQSVSEQICFAKSSILADEKSSDFYESFNKAFPKQRIAFNQSDNLYFVPLSTLAHSLSIEPYSYQSNSSSVKSPEFVSLAPLSNVLVTRNVNVAQHDGRGVSQAFINVDVNNWEKRFLSDIEGLLASQTVCKASDECPDAVIKLVSAKKRLSKNLSSRLIPIRKNSADVPIGEVRAFAEDRFDADLNLAYDTDVIAVYKSELSPSKNISLEPHVDTPHILSATKLSSKNKTFCLFLSNNNQKKSKDLSLSINFPNIEYNIQSTSSGYDCSEWLRLQKPIINSGQIDLTTDTKIPYPLKECPAPPTLSCQAFATSEQEFLFWDWSTVVTANAYEQYTVCLNISFENNPLLKQSKERDAFEVLAEYDFNRQRFLNSIHTGVGFAQAYHSVADLASQLSNLSHNSLKTNRFSEDSMAIIPVKVAFKINEEGIKCTILPDDERDKTLHSLGAVLNPIEHVSGKQKGDVLSFKVSVSHLPIHKCRRVTPTAWVVQNDNLFNDQNHPISEEFIFKTEEVSLQRMRIYADYKIPIVVSETSLQSVVDSIWCSLKADESVRLNISVNYQYTIQGDGSDFIISAPLTFAPNAKKSVVIENIKDWIVSNSSLSQTFDKIKLLFDVTVYENDSDFALIHAIFKTQINQ